MNRDALEKALQYKYPQEFGARQIEIGYEAAFKQVKDEQTGKYQNIPTGIPENSPNHARIEVWPSHLPRPTVGDVEQWATAYDAGASEREAAETARQQREQNKVAIKAKLKALRGTSIKAADAPAILADLLELLELDEWTD